MSNLTARRAYNVTLESKVKELSDQKGAAVVSARGAEERFKLLLEQKEELSEERARLTEALAVLQAEKRGEAELWAHTEHVLKGRVVSLEQQIVDERAALTPRIEAAEEQNRSLQKERDTLSEDRARLQRELSSVQAEKRGLEELTRRLEAQVPPLREEKQQVERGLEASEAKVVELIKEKERVVEEKARLLEELAVLRAEKRGAEELSKKETSQLEGELQAAVLRIDPIEERAKEAGRARDALQEERQHLAEQLAGLQAERRRSDEQARRAEAQAVQALDDKAASATRAEAADERAREATAAKEVAQAEKARAEEHLAVALAERKRVEELSKLSDSKLRDELTASQAHASFAEERCRDIQKHRDAANDERAKATEVHVEAVAAQRAAEEQLAVALAEKKGVEESARRIEETLRAEVAAAVERVKPIEGRCIELQRACDAVHDERHRLARELASAMSSGRAVEEQLHAVSAERRQLEQQLLYVHALTRPATAPPTAPQPSSCGGAPPGSSLGFGAHGASPGAPAPAPAGAVPGPSLGGYGGGSLGGYGGSYSGGLPSPNPPYLHPTPSVSEVASTSPSSWGGV